MPQNSVKGRVQLIKGFKDEQATVTARIAALDKDILDNKTKLIQTQAHIGPVTYIATAFGLDSDNATKYLIYLIIFAFDPMAVALTLAVNIAQRLRREEKEEERRAAALKLRQEEDEAREERMRKLQAEHEERMFAESLAAQIVDHRATEEPTIEPEPVVEEPIVDPVVEDQLVEEPVTDDRPEFELTHPELTEVPEVAGEEPVEHDNTNQLHLDLQQIEEIIEQVEENVVEEPTFNATPPTLDLPPPQQRHYRPYSGLWSNDAGNMDAKVSELIQHYNWLKTRKSAGEELSRDEIWEFQAIEDVLKKHGYNIYL